MISVSVKPVSLKMLTFVHKPPPSGLLEKTQDTLAHMMLV